MALSGHSYVPSVNFFGALGEIGDTIALGRAAGAQEEKDKALLGGPGYKPPASFIDKLVGTVSPQKPAEIEGAVTPTVSRETSTSGKALYDTLIAKGAHPNEAAMLAGEAGVESAYNPTTVHDQGTGYGLWGHRLERLDAMKRATGTDRPSVEQQAEFALQELRSRPEHAKVLAAQSPQELADAGMFYERPQGFTAANPRGGLNYNERLASISKFAGGQPVQVADASGRVPVGGMGASTAQPFDSGARLKALFPTHPGLQTPEGITAAMNAGSKHVREIAKQAWEVYTKDLEKQQGRVSTVSDPEELRALGVPSDFKGIVQRDTTGKLHVQKFGPDAQQTVNVVGEKAFEKKANEGMAENFQKLSVEGRDAQQDMALVSQLRDLRQIAGTGVAPALQGWLAGHGIKVGDNVGAVEAYETIVNKLTPAQRVPGTGATSDYEAAMFKKSLPGLLKTEEGNAIVEQTLLSLAQTKIERAAIAERALIGEASPGETLKALRALPNPYERFKTSRENSGLKGSEAVATQPKLRAPSDDTLTKARAAITTKGRDAVIRYMREHGFDPSGL